jgi:uncharacterized membrane protein YesL
LRAGGVEARGATEGSAGTQFAWIEGWFFCSVMNVLDLIKATIACGGSAFLIYNFPIIGQVIIIGLLSLLWLGYAHKTLATIRRK